MSVHSFDRSLIKRFEAFHKFNNLSISLRYTCMYTYVLTFCFTKFFRSEIGSTWLNVKHGLVKGRNDLRRFYF
jgi:hypothetical protein